MSNQLNERQKSRTVDSQQLACRYKVHFVTADGREEQILVLCDPGGTICDLRDQIGRRLVRAGILVAAPRLHLRLDSRTGPLLDEDDRIDHVILDQTTDHVFAIEVSMTAPPTTAARENTDEKSRCGSKGSEIPSFLRNEQAHPPNGGSIPIKVRVITPHLARLYKDVREVPVIPATFSSGTTLRQVHEQTSQHLGIATNTIAAADRKKHFSHRECNCSLARAIQQGTLFRAPTPQVQTTANRILVIHSRNVIEAMECPSAIDEASAIGTVQTRFGTRSGFDLDQKRLGYFAPVIPPSANRPSVGNERQKPPPESPAMVTICSAKRHRGYEPTNNAEDPDETAPAALSLILDLHTAECPINTQDLDTTLEELCLTELAIDGALTLYAVPRQSLGLESTRASTGQDAIYLDGPHWEPQTKQTERGMAAFLSSLRMAVHLINHQKAENTQAYHDSALHILHVLTRFPPAIRTLHILLDGSAPAEAECAALVQACYEVMVDMMATSVIANCRERILEGSRLFFGTVLSKAQELLLDGDSGDRSTLPYVSSMKFVNLTNSETMEPIAFPVDTSIGLMEQGCYDALKAGIIQFTDDELNHSLDQTILDGRKKRAAILGGGAFSTTIMFDMDIPGSSSHYSNSFSDEGKFFRPGDLTSILQHSTNCISAKLQVTAPASLGSALSPVLTLDRDGFLAVYLGRKPCGVPGQDFLIFRPTKGGECEVSISILAQLLEPIIAARIADGTAIFDGEFYAAERRSDKPDEILMICVDCSSSMSDSAGFADTRVVDEEDDDDEDMGKSKQEILLDSIRRDEIYTGSLNDMKEALQEHESFDDMIHTVSASSQGLKRSVSAQLIKRVADLKITELMHKMESLQSFRRRVWRDHHGEGQRLEDAVNGLRSLIAGILAYESALSEFLVYRACGITGAGQPNTWNWNHGDLIPTLPTQSNDLQRRGFASTPLGLTVPHDLRCPMTQELFQEPMSTQDGHTYEAAAIRKWLRISQTSPLTGLQLPSTQLNVNRHVLLRANNWVEGTGTLRNREPRPFLRARSSASITVNFVSPLSQFTREIPLATPKSTVYELAFRGLRGQYPNFSLAHDGRVIWPDAEPLTTLRPTDGFRITVQLPAGHDHTAAFDGDERGTTGSNLCLVKVYRHHSSVAFSYWARADTNASVGSNLFKAWRHVVETNQFNGSFEDQVIWHSLKYTGDGKMSGIHTQHWEPLSNFLKPKYANGILEPEPLYAKPTIDSPGAGDENLSRDVTSAHSKSGAPLVLKLYTSHATRPSTKRKRDGTHSSRLSILKQMFDQFVNRILAYGYSTHLGLIKFDNTAVVAQPLSPIAENFRSTVQELQSKGDTALWDALALARDQIREYVSAYPDAKRRILCISDGVDTSSKSHKASDLWRPLVDDGIVVDAFCLGGNDNSDLRAISYLTNGYKFHPTSLEQAMAICEMEPVLSQLERDLAHVRESRQPRFPLLPAIRFDRARRQATAEVVTQDVFPKRIEHPSLRDSFVELKAVSRRTMLATAPPMGDAEANSRGGAAGGYTRTLRILTEMQQVVANPHPHVDVYVSEADMSFWKMVMQGPPESIYTGGTFVLYLHMQDTYPSLAPRARFVTPIYHPNVNQHGRICHSILDRNWTADTNNAMVISTIYGLLMEPDYSDPVNIIVTLDFHHDQVAFAEMAREHIQKHATKSRAEWRDEILQAGEVIEGTGHD